jgi:hypothetical protein
MQNSVGPTRIGLHIPTALRADPGLPLPHISSTSQLDLCYPVALNFLLQLLHNDKSSRSWCRRYPFFSAISRCFWVDLCFFQVVLVNLWLFCSRSIRSSLRLLFALSSQLSLISYYFLLVGFVRYRQHSGCRGGSLSYRYSCQS